MVIKYNIIEIISPLHIYSVFNHHSYKRKVEVYAKLLPWVKQKESVISESATREQAS